MKRRSTSKSSTKRTLGSSRLRSSEATPAAPAAEGPSPDENPHRKRMRISRSRPDLDNPQPTFEVLPSLKDVSPSQRPALFLKKIKQCTQLVDFTALNVSQKSVDIKKRNLVDLLEYINFNRNVFSESTFVPIFKMVSANIFHPMLTSHVADGLTYDPDEDEPTLEPSWPHLQFVYEFFLRFILSHDVDPKIAKRYISGRFLLNLLNLFKSEDPRERDYLKTILHKLYAKFMTHRSFIRKLINKVFLTFCYENQNHPGIAELLEILGSIVHGFVLPLKPEHLKFLFVHLLPLYTTGLVTSFAVPLNYCIMLFVEKDVSLAPAVIRFLLQSWPKHNSSKELQFLVFFEDVFNSVLSGQPELLDQPLRSVELFPDAGWSDIYAEREDHEHPVTLPPNQTLLMASVERVASCAMRLHFQVAEKALNILESDTWKTLIQARKDEFFPLLFPYLYAATKRQWSSSVLQITYKILKSYMELDCDLFSSCANRYKEDIEARTAAAQQRQESWIAIKEAAKRNFDRLPVNKRPPKKPCSGFSLSMFTVPPYDVPRKPEDLEQNLSHAGASGPLDASELTDFDPNRILPSGDVGEKGTVFSYGGSKVRRKSILPQDLETLGELKRHKSLDEVLQSTPVTA